MLKTIQRPPKLLSRKRNLRYTQTMLELGKAVDFLKLKLPVLVAIAIALGCFLFLPDNAGKALGIDTLRTQCRSYAACAFLLVTALVAVQLVVKAYGSASKMLNKRKLKRKMVERLHNLTAAEKQILCGYMVPQVRTQYLSIQDGNVNGLCAAGIIFRSSAVGNLFGRGFAFNIRDWAWDYLQGHPDLVLEGVPTDAQGNIIGYPNPDNFLGF